MQNQQLSNILSLKKHLLFQIFHQYQSQFSTWRNSVLTSVFTTHQMHTLGFAHPLLWTSVSQAQKKQYNPTVSPANLEMWEQCAEKGVRSSSKVPWFSFILFFSKIFNKKGKREMERGPSLLLQDWHKQGQSKALQKHLTLSVPSHLRRIEMLRVG